MLQKMLTKKKSFLWVLEKLTFVMENVIEKSWNFVLKNVYEPCTVISKERNDLLQETEAITNNQQHGVVRCEFYFLNIWYMPIFVKMFVFTLNVTWFI